jgi:hypothetical protein
MQFFLSSICQSLKLERKFKRRSIQTEHKKSYKDSIFKFLFIQIEQKHWLHTDALRESLHFQSDGDVLGAVPNQNPASTKIKVFCPRISLVVDVLQAFLINIPLLPSPKDLVPQKHGGEKTTGLSKTTQPIRLLDSSNCAQISSE